MVPDFERLIVRQGRQGHEKIITMWCLTRGTNGRLATSLGLRIPVRQPIPMGGLWGHQEAGKENEGKSRQLNWWVVEPRPVPRSLGGRKHPGSHVPSTGPKMCSVLFQSLSS